MKKIILVIFSLVMIFGAFNTGYAKPIEDKTTGKDKITIDIDPRSKGFDFSDGLYGTNHRYFDNGLGMWDIENKQVFQEFDDMYEESGLKSVRYPGGATSNYFWWKNAIGPVEERKENVNSYRGNKGEVATFGLDEALTWAEKHEQLVTWVYNGSNGNAQDAKELVYYLNAEEGEWAELRAKNGHPEPYNVKHFEIGNEIGWFIMTSAYRSGVGVGEYEGTTLAERYAHGALMKYTHELVAFDTDYTDAAAMSDGSPNQEKFIKHGPAKDEDIKIFTGTANSSAWTTTFNPEEEWERVTENQLEEAGPDEKVYAVKDNQYIIFGNGENGAIPEEGTYIGATYTAWHDGMQQYTDAMNEAAADIGIDINVYSSVDDEEFITTAKDINYDGVVTHPYIISGLGFDVSPSVKSDDDVVKFHKGSLISFDESTRYVEKKQTLLDENKGSLNRDREVVVTEFTNHSGTGLYYGSMSNTILSMDQVLSFFENDLTFALRHSTIDNFFGGGTTAMALYDGGPAGNQDGKFLAQPSAYSYKLLDHMTGDHFLDSEIKNNPVINVDPSLVNGKVKSYDTNQLHSLASIDEAGNIYLIVVNRSATENAEFRVKVPGYQVSTVDVESLWHEDITAVNTYENPNNVGIESSTIQEIKGNGFSYEIPYTSMVGFKLNKVKK